MTNNFNSLLKTKRQPPAGGPKVPQRGGTKGKKRTQFRAQGPPQPAPQPLGPPLPAPQPLLPPQPAPQPLLQPQPAPQVPLGPPEPTLSELLGPPLPAPQVPLGPPEPTLTELQGPPLPAPQPLLPPQPAPKVPLGPPEPTLTELQGPPLPAPQPLSPPVEVPADGAAPAAPAVLAELENGDILNNFTVIPDRNIRRQIMINNKIQAQRNKKTTRKNRSSRITYQAFNRKIIPLINTKIHNNLNVNYKNIIRDLKQNRVFTSFIKNILDIQSAKINVFIYDMSNLGEIVNVSNIDSHHADSINYHIFIRHFNIRDEELLPGELLHVETIDRQLNIKLKKYSRQIELNNTNYQTQTGLKKTLETLNFSELDDLLAISLNNFFLKKRKQNLNVYIFSDDKFGWYNRIEKRVKRVGKKTYSRMFQPPTSPQKFNVYSSFDPNNINNN
jgi:hypothetical protein